MVIHTQVVVIVDSYGNSQSSDVGLTLVFNYTL